MTVFLTGGTGFIGSEILRQLRGHGVQVTALVRSDESAAQVTEMGATALVGDITDVQWLSTALKFSDGAIHTASPGDGTSAAVDSAMVSAVSRAFAGTGKPYVHTGGVWVYGSNDAITERTPFDAPALTSWRRPIEEAALEIGGARVTVVVPGIVYGNGNGLSNLITDAPRTESGAFRMIGDGSQHWTTVHVSDLADLYLKVYDNGLTGSYYIGVSGANPTVRELTKAASRAAGAYGAVEIDTVDATRARLGDLLADALLLDQQASGDRARSELGWNPSQPALLDDLESAGVVDG